VARIRYGGSGVGSLNGFDFQRTGDDSLLRILDNGNIGIGTTTPLTRLHVADSDPGVFPGASAIATFQRAGAAFLYLLTPVNSPSGMFFGTPNSAEDGGIVYNVSGSRAMQLRAGNNVTRVHISGTGEVGIGTSSPTARLDVAGATRVDSLTVDGAITVPLTTRVLSISAAGFTPGDDAQVFNTGAGPSLTESSGASNGNLVEAFAPVHLPEGAVVTLLRASLSDGSPDQNISVQLGRRDLNIVNNSVVTMASVTSAGSAGFQVLSDSTISSATIDNSPFAYYVTVTWTEHDSLLSFSGVLISYTVTSPLP
jgi:hypothetical protein